MESAIIMDKKSQDWINDEVTSKNVFDFVNYLIHNYPEHSEEFIDIKKKMAKKSKSLLSLLITFRRRIDKNDRKNMELIHLISKFIQIVMNNPKGFKK